MKSASAKEIKQELNNRSQSELVALCLHLSRFKKENKELLTYLLYEIDDEAAYIDNIKSEIEEQFELINRTNYYLMKKGVRKILRMIKKYIRYSKKKETEVALLLHFCSELKKVRPSINSNITLNNIYDRQKAMIVKAIDKLHEDLQYDYELELEALG